MGAGRRRDNEDRKLKCFVMRKLERWLSGVRDWVMGSPSVCGKDSVERFSSRVKSS